MRHWINLIDEGSKGEWTGSGPLYHGTDLLALAWIIQSNRLDPSIDSDHPDHHGVSLTTDRQMAFSFADRSSYILASNHNLGYNSTLEKTPKTGAVIELDSEKLRQRYKLVDYVDHLTFDDDEEGDEAEVRCLGTIAPLDAYLVSFSLHPADIEWFVNFLGTEYAQAHYEGTADEIETLKRLVHHPKFRPV